MGLENPDVAYLDSLSQDYTGEEEQYTLILANPPFAGSLDHENCGKALQQMVKTKKTELLFLALIIRLLKPGGRAAVIVADGVLFGSSNAHTTLQKMLVEEQKLDAVISLPCGVFKPYAGVSTTEWAPLSVNQISGKSTTSRRWRAWISNCTFREQSPFMKVLSCFMQRVDEVATDDHVKAGLMRQFLWNLTQRWPNRCEDIDQEARGFEDRDFDVTGMVVF